MLFDWWTFFCLFTEKTVRKWFMDMGVVHIYYEPDTQSMVEITYDAKVDVMTKVVETFWVRDV